ncbi:uncharacterized protein BDV17DRAFT_119261 [Aspergillus undulatus]|uniref:uncharacterized protein n=1 Tax=Aspergillus undulatus TaxID=1810928 RepID=UPI003CCE000E
MTSPRVLQIRRSDEADSHVLLHVSRSDPTALDLHLVGTEGESPYITTLTQPQLKKSKAHNYPGSDKDWQETVLSILGLQQGPTEKSEPLTGVETSACIIGDGDDDKELVITVKQRIQTITQKLGALTLHQDDEHDIELFEWSRIAITRADTLEERFNTLVDRYRTAEDTINRLNKQLEEFLSTKAQHEQQLMSEFVQLLNEKKLKIRNQQRLLASAKVDTEKLSTIQSATGIDGSSRNAKARKSKRPAGSSADETDSEDHFGKMDVDQSRQKVDNGADQETDGGGRSTPQPLEDDSTTSDDEEPVLSANKPRQGRQRQELPQKTAARPPPPRRELPFARKPGKETAPARPTPVLEDLDRTGGETDDDEL